MSAGLSTVITNFAVVRKEVCTAVQDYIKDTTFPLVDRWAIFKQASKSAILPYHDYVQSLDTFDDLDVSWYDDFYKDRYALVEWIDVIESIEDTGATKYDGEPNRYFEHIEQVKEEILEMGYAGFTYDW